MQDILAKLKKELENRRLTQSEFADRIGFSQGKISHWFRGRREISLADVEKINQVLDINLLEKGNDGSFSLDLLDVSVSAGSGLMLFDENVIRSVAFDKSRFKGLFGIEPTNQLKIITVKGDSMMPTFKENDFLLVDTANTSTSDGVYVFRVGDSLYVKRLQLTPSGVIALSDNKNYGSFNLEAFDIVAKVVNVLKNEKI